MKHLKKVCFFSPGVPPDLKLKLYCLSEYIIPFLKSDLVANSKTFLLHMPVLAMVKACNRAEPILH